MICAHVQIVMNVLHIDVIRSTRIVSKVVVVKRVFASIRVFTESVPTSKSSWRAGELEDDAS